MQAKWSWNHAGETMCADLSYIPLTTLKAAVDLKQQVSKLEYAAQANQRHPQRFFTCFTCCCCCWRQSCVCTHFVIVIVSDSNFNSTVKHTHSNHFLSFSLLLLSMPIKRTQFVAAAARAIQKLSSANEKKSQTSRQTIKK